MTKKNTLTKKIWLVQINLGGIHPVYEMTLDEESGQDGEHFSWWDKSGNICYDVPKEEEENIKQIVFTTKKEAEAAKLGMDLVGEFLKTWLS